MSADQSQKFTPGPWEVIPAGAEGWRAPGEYEAKDFAIRAPNGVCPGIVWDFHEQGEANARLIAAAPQMLAALKNVLDWRENGPHNTREVWGWVRAAIAKAEGVTESASVKTEG